MFGGCVQNGIQTNQNAKSIDGFELGVKGQGKIIENGYYYRYGNNLRKRL